MFVSWPGFELPLPAWMSMSFVPAAVPLDFQSSLPWVASWALKKSVPATSVREAGLELPLPGTMSRTSFVPAAVPFDLQSS